MFGLGCVIIGMVSTLTEGLNGLLILAQSSFHLDVLSADWLNSSIHHQVFSDIFIFIIELGLRNLRHFLSHTSLRKVHPNIDPFIN